MIRKDQAPEARNRRQPGNQHRFTRTPGENARMLLLGEPIQDVNAISDTNADDQGQCHHIGRVKRNIKVAHDSQHPHKSKTNRQQRTMA